MTSSGLTPAIIEELRAKGFTQNQIAEAYGVSRQYVSKLKRNAGMYTESPREIALKSYPWKTGERFNEHPLNRWMRHHAEYMATGGKDMAPWKLERLAWLYRHLMDNNLVVEFDPNLPPEESSSIGGGSSVGGFALRPREDSDGDLIIRVNEHTTLTDEGRMVWRFPPKLPEV
jgi:transcriptional regulator with XRE-family HTH domain